MATAFASGTGTEADPYVIATPEQLAFLAQSVKAGETYEGKFIVLSADIDLGGKEWMPIGLYKYENTSGNDFPFNGSFDGKGYTVSNFVVTAGNNTIYAGLFALVTGDAVIKNINIAKATVAGKNYAGVLVGKFAGKELSGIVVGDDCSATGTASIGGVAGRIVPADAKYLVNNGTVSGTGNGNSSYIGGICGCLGGNATLSYSVNNGKISGDVAFSGGLVGMTGADSGAGNIENCYNAGVVVYGGTKTSRYAGGIAARLANAANLTYVVKNTYNIGTVSIGSAETLNVGEIAAELKNVTTFENVYSVDVAGVDLFMSGKVAASADVSAVLNKTEAEIKALTAAIDAKIAENKVTPPAAPETTTPSAPETTVPSTPETNAPTTTPVQPSNPETGDVSAVILAAVCVTGLAAVMVVKKKER